MNRKLKPLIGIIVFGIVFAATIFIYNIVINMGEGPINLAQRGFEPGEAMRPAPDFVIQDFNGVYLYSSEFKGKPIVLSFWNTWCNSCVVHMPLFSDLYWGRYGDLHVLKVNLLDGERETLDSVLGFMVRNDYTFPIYFDQTGESANNYGITSVPVTVFINADGYIRYRIHGSVTEASLQRGLDFIIG